MNQIVLKLAIDALISGLAYSNIEYCFLKTRRINEKPLMFLLILAVCISSLFADPTDFQKASLILNNAKIDTLSLVSQYTTGLSDSERMMLYNENKKDTTTAFLLNLLVGAGIGSYVQKDAKGGTTQLIGDIASGILMTVGYCQGMYEIIESIDSRVGTVMLATGLLSLISFRVFASIRPFDFAKDYNDKLSQVCYGKAVPEIAVMPVFLNNQLGVALQGKISF